MKVVLVEDTEHFLRDLVLVPDSDVLTYCNVEYKIATTDISSVVMLKTEVVNNYSLIVHTNLEYNTILPGTILILHKEENLDDIDGDKEEKLEDQTVYKKVYNMYNEADFNTLEANFNKMFGSNKVLYDILNNVSGLNIEEFNKFPQDMDISSLLIPEFQGKYAIYPRVHLVHLLVINHFIQEQEFVEDISEAKIIFVYAEQDNDQNNDQNNDPKINTTVIYLADEKRLLVKIRPNFYYGAYDIMKSMIHIMMIAGHYKIKRVDEEEEEEKEKNKEKTDILEEIDVIANKLELENKIIREEGTIV